MALRILKTDQSLVQRSPRIEEPDYLDWIRKLPCLVCLRPSDPYLGRTHPAHIRYNDARFGAFTGGGERPDDRFSLPLCVKHHVEQTDVGEGPQYWEGLGMTPHAMCLALRHIAYPSIEEGGKLVKAWHGWISDGR